MSEPIAPRSTKSAPQSSKASSLHIKIAEISGKLETIPKTGYNSFHKYHYATEGDVMNALRPLLSDAAITIRPSIIGAPQLIDLPTGSGGGRRALWLSPMRFIVTDGESGETFADEWWAAAEDGADKGLGKCATSGVKSYVMKLFNIPTGDDIERDSVNESSSGSRPTSSGGNSNTITDGQRKLFFGKANGAGLLGADGKVDELFLRRLIRWKTGAEHITDVLKTDVDGVVLAIERAGANRIQANETISAWEEERGLQQDVFDSVPF